MGDNEVKKISMAVIKRLPRYHRYLAELLRRDITRISSAELSRLMGLTASQIRQDLNNFGGFGQQGYGYNVSDLYYAINRILGLNTSYNMIIVGAGNLGQALANNTDFSKRGFILKGLFDINPKLIGLKIRDVEIMDIDVMEEFIYTEEIDIGVICTGRESAQETADRLVKAGIKGIWNFAPEDIKVPEDVALENVHLSDSLLTLSYIMNEKKLARKFS